MGLSLRAMSFLGLLLPALNNYLLPSITNFLASVDKTLYIKEVRISREIPKDSFDFIVVGGGSAGSVVTNRLSKHFSVLLLERGGEPNPVSAIPLNTIPLTGHPAIDYASKTVPQKAACLGNHNQGCSWNRGKGLGGSSNINWQIYLRGHELDYQAWANITGDERWNYKNVLPFFLKSEEYCVSCEKHENDPTFNPAFHNTDGLLSVGKSTSQPLTEEFIQASEWDGIKRTDLNAPYREGCAPIVFTVRNGRRCSTKVAFINPVRGRPNLKIKKYARAYKLLFKDGTNEAYGVEYEHLGIHKIAYATKEIIVSTGAIETPKLLMLSGIGPRDHLKALDVPLRLDLPVGKNLMDHLGVIVGPFFISKGKSLMLERDVTFKNVVEYFSKGTGPFSNSGVSATSFWSSSVAKNNGEPFWPDVQHLFSGVSLSKLFEPLLKGLNMRLDLANQFVDLANGKDNFLIYALNMRPKSRGEITLKSKNYQDDPLIDPKYNTDVEQADIKILIEGIKRAVHIAENAPSFKNINSQLISVHYPSCVNTTLKSDEYWDCLARYFSYSSFHYSGTAAMGKEKSPDAVVDSELRVLGVKGLRVIDASVMPIVPSVNINAPTIMVAERGAQLILDMYLDKLNY